MNHEKITEEAYDYFLGVLPPIATGKRAIGLLSGAGEDVSGWIEALISSEPYSHERDQRTGNVYPTFTFCYKKGAEFFKGKTAPDQEIASAYKRFY